MIIQRTMAVSLVLVLAGCTSTATQIPPEIEAHRTGAEYSPIQAIVAVAEHPNGVVGTFAMDVRDTGRKDGWLYLNSELDYRDQRCLTIAIPESIDKALRAKWGEDPATHLHGKRIKIYGRATRVTVWFTVDGVRTDRYYYQTQIQMTKGSELAVIKP